MARLGYDEDTGSLINLGRTLQEPMARMNMRDRIIDLEPHLIALLETLAEQIENNDDAILPGHTHWSQANPITLASFYLSVFDEAYRAITLLEHAYLDVNSNTGGCGATSGISWPVDRQLLTELLGFDSLLEPTYAGEASQDQSMTLMYALSNLGILISRVTTTMQAWALEEVGILAIRPEWAGVSSYMPQKAHPGAVTEVARMMATDTITQMLRGVLYSKNEFYGDVLPIMEMGQSIPPVALNNASVAVQMFRQAVINLEPQKERMLRLAEEGFSCATEVVVHMVKNLGYGGRRAHRITAHFIRMAREKGLAANECTGELLDAAARHVEDCPPQVDTATLRRLLDPRVFLKTHIHIGGIAPTETQRLLKLRRGMIADYKARAATRRDKRDAALKTLREKADTAILNCAPIEAV
jgi:argininosuccinate lyase